MHQHRRSCMGISTQIPLCIESESPNKEDVVNFDEIVNEDLGKLGKIEQYNN